MTFEVLFLDSISSAFSNLAAYALFVKFMVWAGVILFVHYFFRGNKIAVLLFAIVIFLLLFNVASFAGL